jgi:hypothetical protein
MAESGEELERHLGKAILPAARNRLLARGLARGMIWSDGQLPSGAPVFSRDLSSDLLDHGYGVLSRALRLRVIEPDSEILEDAFRVASEAIESTARRGNPDDRTRGFQLLVAAVSSHLGGYAARAFTLMSESEGSIDLSSDERCLSLILLRSLSDLRRQCVEWLARPEHQDLAIADALSNSESLFELDDALEIALRKNVHRAIGLLDSALMQGDQTYLEHAFELLSTGREAAAESGFVPAWWIHVLLEHLAGDLWSTSFWSRMPQDAQWDGLRRDFIQLLSQRDPAQVALWPSQLEAARRAVDPSDDLVVALPTSAGKTRIAELCILRALADGQRAVYVTPLRALSAQQERTLARTFRPLGASVSSLYGASGVARADIATLEGGNIVVATPEKLDFALRHQPSLLDDVGLIVLDEGHMIGINEREVRYEALVQRLLNRQDAERRRLVCLSAVFGSGELTADFTRWIRSDAPGSPIESQWRPTRHRPATLFWDGTHGRLEFSVEEERPYIPQFVRAREAISPRRLSFPKNRPELVLATADALAQGGANVLVYCTQRNNVESLTRTLLDLIRRGYLSEYPVNGAMRHAQRIGEEWLGAEHPAIKALSLGIAMHHGGLPRTYLNEVEQLLASRTLRYAIASPTVAQGLDLSASALVFHSLHRSGRLINEEEYRNVIGRVGRAFVNLDGLSVFPIDTTERNWEWRREQYDALVRGAGQRALKSGIAQLIERLISTVVGTRSTGRDEAIEYLLGQQTVWLPTEEKPPKGSPKKVVTEFERLVADFEKLVANLDSALLSTVENLGTTADSLSDVLDDALRDSLWRRTLAGLPKSEREQQQRLLFGRARWLWERTTPEIRKGFFECGIGFQAGAVLRENIDELFAAVSAADTAIAIGDVDDAAAMLVRIEKLLDGVHPFGAEDKPEKWEILLENWISGDSIARADSTASDFVQGGLVYRLVWAVEAIRAYAEAVGIGEPGTFSGRVSMALTYGAPSIAAAHLIRYGLPSRRLAMEVVRRFPPPGDLLDEEDPEFDEWLDEVLTPDLAEKFAGPLDSELWRDFVGSSAAPSRRWSRTTSITKVRWDSKPAPKQGTPVRLVPDDGVTHVCSIELERLGSTVHPITHIVRATVRGDGRLDIERFGP